MAPVLALLVFASPLAGCASPSSPPTSSSELPTGLDAEWNIVIIGDSSLWELGWPLAHQIERDVGVRVTVDDVALLELSAGRVLQALRTGESENLALRRLSETLQEAEVVVMWVNPVDSLDPANPHDFDGCFVSEAPKVCSPESLAQFVADLEALWATILELRGGQPTILRATDLYNPLVVPWKERDVFEACSECWQNLSDAARTAADASGVPFFSRYAAFNGPDHDWDPRAKGYIQSDGEHPTERMGEATAKLLSELGFEPVATP
jgi:hypothetical protein